MSIDKYLEEPYKDNGVIVSPKAKKINKDKVEILKLNKKIRELNRELKLNRPIEKITISVPETISWKETVEKYRKMFLERPDHFQGSQGVFNYSMSPRELMSHFLTPQQVKLEGDKLMEKEHKVSNSTLNRPPSKKGDLFLKRHAYAFNIVTGYADSNFFPLSMIDNRDLDTSEFIYHLMLKDRGNLTYILNKSEEAILTVNNWNFILGKLKAVEEFNEYLMKCSRYYDIFKNAEDNLSQFHSKVDRENQKLSLKEVIGEDVYTEWLDSPQGINLRCKFETLGVHTNEMQKYNNNETGWVEYNFLNCDLGIKGYYTPQDISKEALSEIHNFCLDNDVFIGKKEFLNGVNYKNYEGFESWWIIENVANSPETWTSFINTIARSSKKPTDKKRKNWEKLFTLKQLDKNKEPKKKNGSYLFKTVKTVEKVVRLVEYMASSDGVKTYHDKLEETIANNASLDVSNLQGNKIKLSHPDTCHIIVKGVKEVTKNVFKQRNELEKEKQVFDAVITTAVQQIDDGILSNFVPAKNKEIASNSMTRYNLFWKPIFKKTEERLDLQVSQGKLPANKAEFTNQLGKNLSKKFMLDEGKMLVFDQEGNGIYKPVEIDFTSPCKYLQWCHLDNSISEVVDNMFLGLKGVNKNQGNTPIPDLAEWIENQNRLLDEYQEKNKIVYEIGKPNLIKNTQAFNKAALEVFEDINQ